MRDFHHHLLLFLYLFLLSLYQASIASSLSTAPKAAHHRCRDDQRSAFAQLQENLKFPVSSSKAELWDLKTDCCSWEGVTCNDVGHATRLDLSSAHDEYGDSISLKKPNLGMLFQNLSFLVELNLDYVNISAQGSNWCEVISHVLPNLRVLSLSHSGLSGPLCSSLSKLHFLSELHLDSNSELSSIPPSFLANSSNLETLGLSYCGLNGSFPYNIFLLPKLQHIDLSENLLLSGQFPEFSLNSSIQSLLLKNTNFSGNIPLSISNLKSLKELDLSRCKFYGVIPPSLANLTQLETLDLSFNSFNGSIPPFQRDGVANLSSLSLEHNQLNGILYSSIFTLPSLQNLDLSSNQLSGQLDEFSDASSSLLIIELSNNNLSGSIPRSIFKLPSLIELNLQYNKFSGPLKLGDFKNQRDLAFLALSGVSVESANSSLAYVQLATLYLPSCNLTEFPDFLKTQNSLTELDLSNNRIQGYVPSWIWKTTLTTLYLSRNPLDFPKIPPFVKVNHSTPIYNEDGVSSFPMTLKYLGMSSCNITGSFPEFIKNQETLLYLDLSDNKLVGHIPKWIWNMSLKYLNLSCNKFDFLDQFSNPISLPYSDTLITLDLHANHLSGSFPKAICNCSQLSLLDMSHNHLRSQIPDCLGKVTTLTVLNLQGNKFDSISSYAIASNLLSLKISDNKVEGKLPSSLANCSKLEVLDLGGNMIRDTFPVWLEKLPALKILVLQANKFYGPIGNRGTATTWPMLHVMDLSSNEFTGNLLKEFVQSLGGMQLTSNNESRARYVGYNYHIMESVTITNKGRKMHMDRILTLFTYLDLSDNKLGGQIPKWIWNMSLIYLNLSCNNFDFLDQFSNPISLPYSDTLITLDLHANQLPGSFPKAICNCSQLSLLDMSYNHFRSQIPDCLGKVPTLTVLNLQGNNFDSISSYAIASDLRSLKISDNKVEGKLPRSLANCSKLEVLDLGGNMIRDTFPVWLDKLTALTILVLQANKFYGPIGSRGTATTWPMLHVMDLSSNEFTGNLLKEFVQSLVGMQLTSNNESRARYVGDNYHINGYYKESVTITNKGRKMRMDRIITLFTCLDISNNSFHGEIPEEIRILKSLIVLTLSHNNFLGQIPSSLSDLTELESLDLSSNHLSGEIPPQLSRLTFLAVMNLSYNHLEGRIPQGNQFLTFPSSSYEGNPRLCGPPLTRKCNPEVNEPATPPADHEDSWTEYILDWKIVGIGYASGIVIGFSVGYTILSEMRIKWFTDLIRLAGNKERWFNQGQRGLQSW